MILSASYFPVMKNRRVIHRILYIYISSDSSLYDYLYADSLSTIAKADHNKLFAHETFNFDDVFCCSRVYVK